MILLFEVGFPKPKGRSYLSGNNLIFFLYKLQCYRILKLEEALEVKSLSFATDKIGMMYHLAFSV